MISDASPLDADPTAPSPRFTRRSLLAGLGCGAAALTIARTGGSVGAVAGQLNDAGAALAPARRIPPTTTTTTSPPVSTIPAGDGEIPFPILVGADDSCYVGRNFGAPRGCCRSHEGLDLMADQGLAVVAVADGTLTKKYEDSGLNYGAGNGWTLTDETNDVVYKFFHLDSHADGLEEGDEVTVGQVLGYIGETGTSGANSTLDNFHLHFEYRPGNIPMDPFDLLVRAPHVRFTS